MYCHRLCGRTMTPSRTKADPRSHSRLSFLPPLFDIMSHIDEIIGGGSGIGVSGGSGGIPSNFDAEQAQNDEEVRPFPSPS